MLTRCGSGCDSDSDMIPEEEILISDSCSDKDILAMILLRGLRDHNILASMDVFVMPLVVAPTPPARDVVGRLEAPPAPPRMERRSWTLLMIMMNNMLTMYGNGIVFSVYILFVIPARICVPGRHTMVRRH